MATKANKRRAKRGRSSATFQCEEHERRSLRNRLAKIGGQVAAIQRMIDENADCELILQQLAAARAAMNRSFAFVLARMVAHCHRSELTEPQREDLTRLVAELIERYV